MKNLRKWFTLVELIVVITILAILGTIAFISLQGYSGDARNSKRVSDLNSITSAVKNQLTEGQSYMSFVTQVTDNLSSTRQISGTAATLATEYNAGTVNYTALPVKSSDFQDPLGNNSYIIGATTRAGWAVEMAASMEQGGQRVAKLIGDWVPRLSTTLVSGTGTAATNSWTLTNTSDINKLKAGDNYTLSGGTSSTGTVLSISPDGMTFKLSGNIVAGNIQILLTNSEITGLIDKKDTSPAAGTAYVSDGSSTNLPY